MTNIRNTEELRNSASGAKNQDIKVMSTNLMKEMLWLKPKTTIEMYTLKKHIQNIPTFKNKNITGLRREEYDLLSTS